MATVTPNNTRKFGAYSSRSHQAATPTAQSVSTNPASTTRCTSSVHGRNSPDS